MLDLWYDIGLRGARECGSNTQVVSCINMALSDFSLHAHHPAPSRPKSTLASLCCPIRSHSSRLAHPHSMYLVYYLPPLGMYTLHIVPRPWFSYRLGNPFLSFRRVSRAYRLNSKPVSLPSLTFPSITVHFPIIYRHPCYPETIFPT